MSTYFRYALYRSTRGVVPTIELVKRGSFTWGAVSGEDIFVTHARDAIARDGSPTGIEHVMVLQIRHEPTILRFRSWWTEYAGAARLRTMLLDVDATPLDTALIGRVLGHLYRDRHERAFIVELDSIFPLVEVARDALDARLAIAGTTIELLEQPMLCSIYDALWNEGLQPKKRGPPAASARERELVAAIVAAPRDDDALDVYADYLEERNRVDEYQVLRELVVGEPED